VVVPRTSRTNGAQGIVEAFLFYQLLRRQEDARAQEEARDVEPVVHAIQGPRPNRAGIGVGQNRWEKTEAAHHQTTAQHDRRQRWIAFNAQRLVLVQSALEEEAARNAKDGLGSPVTAMFGRPSRLSMAQTERQSIESTSRERIPVNPNSGGVGTRLLHPGSRPPAVHGVLIAVAQVGVQGRLPMKRPSASILPKRGAAVFD
jgi:hypothetical protein